MKFGKMNVSLWLLGLHSVAMILGASLLWPKPAGALGTVLDLYGELTAASHNFGFFAPRVASPSRVRVVIHTPTGSFEDQRMGKLNAEGCLRISGFREVNIDDEQAKQMKRLTAAAIAAQMFDKYPSASRVEVYSEALLIPTIQQSQEGKVAHWTKFYSIEFKRKGKK